MERDESVAAAVVEVAVWFCSDSASLRCLWRPKIEYCAAPTTPSSTLARGAVEFANRSELVAPKPEFATIGALLAVWLF